MIFKFILITIVCFFTCGILSASEQDLKDAMFNQLVAENYAKAEVQFLAFFASWKDEGKDSQKILNKGMGSYLTLLKSQNRSGDFALNLAKVGIEEKYYSSILPGCPETPQTGQSGEAAIVKKTDGSSEILSQGTQGIENKAEKIRKERNYFFRNVKTPVEVNRQLAEQLSIDEFTLLDATPQSDGCRVRLLVTDGMDAKLKEFLQKINNLGITADFRVFRIDGDKKKMITAQTVHLLEGKDGYLEIKEDWLKEPSDAFALECGLNVSGDGEGFFRVITKLNVCYYFEGISMKSEKVTEQRTGHDIELFLLDNGRGTRFLLEIDFTGQSKSGG
ncbi:MAG: hypothetical protein PHW04_11100 [Candidatus Wallbacteria bacterium]|nr:hypothetical protein [Candidatus Wallbacteria bacterium]